MKKLRDQIKNDDELKSKGSKLLIVAALLIAINTTGATLEEANTFIFKINFKSGENIKLLLLAATAFLTIRYYSYAQGYHAKFYRLWTRCMLSDPIVMRENHITKNIGGLISKKIDVYTVELPEVFQSKYITKTPFRRALTFEQRSSYPDDNGEYDILEHYVNLNEFSNSWRPRDLLKLLQFELKYQIEGLIKHREGLDLLAPYLFSLLAAASCLLK